MRARKRFGQHFLHDPAVLERILRAVGPRAGDHIVEIGPGRGALTRLLLAAAPATLDAIEIDRDLAAGLCTRLGSVGLGSAPGNGSRPAAADDAQAPARGPASPAAHLHAAGVPRFTLHVADALDFDFGALAHARGARLRIAGNLPYNISTPLLFHFLDHRGALEDLHLMLQREVVARLAARPGSGDYGRLTVMLAPWTRVERLFDVGPGAFQPPPRVWSAVVRLTFREQPAFEVHTCFARVVAAAFSQRRKTLRNALRGLVPEAQITACGIDSRARPDTLAPEDFNTLARHAILQTGS